VLALSPPGPSNAVAASTAAAFISFSVLTKGILLIIEFGATSGLLDVFIG
jgi:hypothetical protein